MQEQSFKSISVSVDVPNIEDGIAFYSQAFGFTKVATPAPGVAVLRAGSASLCLLEKAAGTSSSPATSERRRYERHWTPVHLDFHVEDLKAALTQALKAGAKQEQLFEHTEHGSAAFCSDPFGHGFCLLEGPQTPER
jgi:predicted enzyme related to lactoylglutathione lyase